MERKQLLIDWEKSGRCLASLELHCRLAGLTSTDTALLICLAALGHVDEEGNSYWYFSVREASRRSKLLAGDFRQRGDTKTEDGQRWLQLAAQATLAPGSVSKSIRRLGEARKQHGEPELVRYEEDFEGDRRCWRLTVSWRRVWSLKLRFQRFGALPPPQEKKDIYPPSPRTKNQERTRVEDVQAGKTGRAEANEPFVDLQTQHAAQVDRLAKRLLNAIAAVEDRQRIPNADRLSWHAARRVAGGICDDPDSGTMDEVDRIFGSLARKEEFKSSPAAYFIQCAKRRGWIQGKTRGLAATRLGSKG